MRIPSNSPLVDNLLRLNTNNTFTKVYKDKQELSPAPIKSEFQTGTNISRHNHKKKHICWSFSFASAWSSSCRQKPTFVQNFLKPHKWCRAVRWAALKQRGNRGAKQSILVFEPTDYFSSSHSSKDHVFTIPSFFGGRPVVTDWYYLLFFLSLKELRKLNWGWTRCVSAYFWLWRLWMLNAG